VKAAKKSVLLLLRRARGQFAEQCYVVVEKR
jgi:hypothetical protein